ncbi:cytochrome c biogenesis protein DipZ [Actinotalea sp. M2MS4P-6]|uniref:cytochrome c biogenesis protein DipZ n=1 Tax=Actinotalea sp. M2MS4P-6 TaxID=2983762 RepID=UPI0021E509F6|nr:cytochrome c biogenesis protein DipZ [Actinotalea sp. M2MS4P-6]MCV2396067.1 cytochrome c biogenesis protein DipZ [Actinotalea sp. M2MS4P-6]
MTTLVLVGLVSGVITALSPCVLPVLPVVLTTAAPGPGSRRRPWVVVGGLVLSFGVFTLLGGALLSLLHLPADLLRWIGVAILGVVGLGLVWPRFGHLLEAPFARTRMPALDRNGNGFVLGLGLGLVFVPCAGPILASITVLAATAQIGPGLVVLTAAYCVGIAIPLLVMASAGGAILGRVKAFRERTPAVRTAGGVIMIVTALVIATNIAEPLQRLTPSWLSGLSDRVENDTAVRAQLDALAGEAGTGGEVGAASTGPRTFDECAADPSQLADCGTAPELTGITGWINSAPLELADLRGKVVLLDFWTYSCINCQRTLPYLTQWYDTYHDDGLVVLGVHSPEFAFEQVPANVEDNAARLGVTYPVALDNDFATWRAYDQHYWPAHYLIDRTGEVRQVHYGEGAYAETEALIQELLGAPADGTGTADAASGLTADRTPETYLGSARMGPHTNAGVTPGEPATYTLDHHPPQSTFSLGGTWTVEAEYVESGDDARLTLGFHASAVYLVLAGDGAVTVTVGGETHEVDVSGSPALYTLYDGGETSDVLHLTAGPGIQAYAFTFG